MGSDTTSLDNMALPPGEVLFFLVRGRNACPSGLGTLGHASSGEERIGRTCP